MGERPHAEDASPESETLMEKIADKPHVGGGDGPSSSDSEVDERPRPSAPPAPADVTATFAGSAAAAAAEAKAKVFRLFGREQPIHKVLDGGKPVSLVKRLEGCRSRGVSLTLVNPYLVAELKYYEGFFVLHKHC